MGKSSIFILACILGVTWAAYVPRRNVHDYGAVGDGVADDTSAIIRAITEGRGDNPNAAYPTVYSSSSLTPALVYFPPGVYRVSDTLPLIYYTQLVGDADSVPTIKVVSTGGVDIRIIDSLSEQWGGNLVNQNNFFHQVRNFVLDMTECESCTGIHWQVAQATQLSNIHFKMKKGSKCQGIWMENGSGGFISDLVFDGGMYGMWVGNQQFTSRNITIRDASVAGMYLNWDWSWVFKGLDISGSPVGIDVGGTTGSLTVFDSKFSDISVAAIRTSYVVGNNFSATATASANSLVLDNVVLTPSAGSNAAVVLNGESVALAGSGSASTQVKSWVQGRVWQNGKSVLATRDLSAEGLVTARPSVLTAGSDSYFQMARPAFDSARYTRLNAVTHFGVVNDGVTDVTASLQKALTQSAAEGAVLFLPYGTYLISNTLFVPAGSRVLGEAWSVIMVSSAVGVFSNPASPVAAIKVGNEGDAGVAQLVDLLVTIQGPVPGAKLIEWNIADPVGQPGSAGLWEVHFRVGGAIGTRIDPSNCPRGDGGNATATACAGAWALMHITTKATAYLENVWGWVADHDLDYDDQINVYNARGLLVESQGPVWMYGTAFEHSLLYQYNLHGAKNTLMAMIQTETPYFQPSAKTPFSTSNPTFAAVLAPHVTDPAFCTGDSRCDMALGLTIQNASSDVFLYGTGLYSFFYMWDQTCLASDNTDGIMPTCQLETVKISSDSKITLYNLNTYGAVYMTTAAEAYSSAADNLNTFCSNAVVDLTHRG